MNETRIAETGLRLRSHCIHMENREVLSITGVKDVGSFNDREVTVFTDAGGMTVEGEGLHITKLNLDDGQIIIEGEICAIDYDDDSPAQKGSFLSRVFR